MSRFPWHMTDDERIALREAAVQTLSGLQQRRVLHMVSELKLHDECGGTGLLAGSVSTPCKYCAGSGRVVHYTANTVVPYRSPT